jgi:hypothetical protein
MESRRIMFTCVRGSIRCLVATVLGAALLAVGAAGVCGTPQSHPTTVAAASPAAASHAAGFHVAPADLTWGP